MAEYRIGVVTNMFGDILTDEAAGLVGGLGMAPGLCAGPKYAMAQATHGSAPDIAGRNIANPYAMVMSGQMLLSWLGGKKQNADALNAANDIRRGLEKVLDGMKAVTPDLGGQGSTSGMGDAICQSV